MAASLEAQSLRLEEILSKYDLKEEDLCKKCSQAIRYEIAIKITEWELMGYQFCIPYETLVAIKRENTTENQRRVVMLCTWYQQEGSRATYHRLIEALYSQNRRDLVEFLCDLIKKSHTAITATSSDEQQQPTGTRPQCHVKDRKKKLEKQFKDLFHLLEQELQRDENTATVEEILKSLTVLPSRKLQLKYDILIREKIPEPHKVTTVSQLFYMLAPLFTFLDYHLLKYLISKFGSETLVTNMSSFKRDLKIFMSETTVSDMIKLWPGDYEKYSKHSSELWVKISKNSEKYTLKRLRDFQKKHYAQIGLSDALSILVSVAPASSFYAVWTVPTVVVNEVATAIRQVDPNFYELEHVVMIVLDNKLLYLSDSTNKGRWL